ncbi:hypothetical protein LOCC1_G005096 [Lachnellula occidentalis]|uniref:Uncharacterized protein n=1 Tax=Lachnellula occidentalis TaxID=215460 RepID=A0A8H8RZ72_9HELO|nr:hypothetical protein LOCC1_G005096 [Lachnellula occidentalis]
MPFGIHKHSNRSRQALNDQGQAAHGQDQGTAPLSIASSGDPSAFPPPPPPVFTQQQYQQSQAQVQQQHQQPPHTPPLLEQPAIQQAPPHSDSQPYQRRSPAQSPDFEQRPYPSAADLPSRSQSTRYSSAYPTPQQQHQVLRPQAAGSADDLSLDSRRIHQQPRAQPAPAPIPEQRKSKSIFERMRSTTNRLSQSDPKSLPQGQYNNTSGISRRLSKRQDNPPAIRTVQHQQSSDQQRVDSQTGPQGSRSHLPSPQEANEDDSGLDPYLIRGPDQENDQRRSPSQEGQGQQPTIRPVQSDSEPAPFHPNDEGRQQFQTQQLQHPQQHGIHHRPTSGLLINYELHNQSHHPQQQVHQPGLIIHAPFQQQNAETVSQLSHDSPIEQREEQRPVSVHSNGQSPTTYQHPQFPDRSSSFQGPRPLPQVGTAMAPPTGASQQNRRSADPKQSMQGPQGQPESRESPQGPPPNYSRIPSFQGNNQPAAPGLSPMPSSVSAQGSTYRGGPPQRDQYGPTAPGEQGRSTPPPQPASQDVEALYKELQIKYKKVKGLYFDKTGQVEQLQNSLANQRLSQSRTSLDDSEYMTRFQRLDGATTNLAFNIRKDWNVVPAWLAPFTNQEAIKIGKQEMTAVGRACISKFLVDEVFNRTFHPGLEDSFSSSLKSIEQNIRRFSPALNNQEESDALTAKVVQWRLTTLEGLKDVLSTAESEEYKKDFAQYVTSRLTASLINNLQEPVPVGIEDSAHMIVELAVSIASNLPLESRDISIVYPMPGDMLQPFIMKTEAGIPALENPGVDTSSEIDSASTGSGDKEELAKEGEKPEGGKLRKEKTKSTGGMLQAMMGGSSNAPSGKKPSVSSQGGQDGSSEGKVKASTEDGAQKVRFAGFVGVEVRGRQVLCKAPVWTIA